MARPHLLLPTLSLDKLKNTLSICLNSPAPELPFFSLCRFREEQALLDGKIVRSPQIFS